MYIENFKNYRHLKPNHRKYFNLMKFVKYLASI